MNVETLLSMAELIELRGLSEALLTQLRALYPGKHFTYCMDDDIHSGKPVLERANFKIYLVDSSEHCSHLLNGTEPQALQHASGFVLAEVVEE
ncbi:MAG: hypothetical protein QM709_12710 [Spongiibacteraceae bacterium]